MTDSCDWPVNYDGCPSAEDSFESVDQQDVFEEMATDLLRLWTLNTYGLCTVAVRPCRSDCEQSASFWGRGPYPMAGMNTVPLRAPSPMWGAGAGCGVCGVRCTCGTISKMRLSGRVERVLEVVIDGATLDPAAYGVLNNAVLVRKDGGLWPTCQDLAADTTAADTFEVTYQRGRPVPVGGQVAAAALAIELAKAACNDSSCKLPSRIQTITRQGVTMTVLDSFTELDEGGTGIYLIDSWLASVRKSPKGARVRSVDVASPRPGVARWT